MVTVVTDFSLRNPKYRLTKQTVLITLLLSSHVPFTILEWSRQVSLLRFYESQEISTDLQYSHTHSGFVVTGIQEII